MKTTVKILALLLILSFTVLPLFVSCVDKNPPEETGTASSTPAPASEPETTEPQTTEPPETEPVNIDVPVASGDFTYTVADSKATIRSYSGAGGDLIIPEQIDGFTVVSLAKMLFAYCDSLTSVTIPGSIKDTGELTFYHCTGLKTVYFGDGVEKIGMSCFNSCTALNSFNRTDSLRVVSEGAFQGCQALREFDLTGVTELGYRAFANSGLTSVTVPATVTVFEDAVFFGTKNLVKADIQTGSNIENLPTETFGYCFGLKEVTLPEGMKRIGESAFYRCTSLESLVLPSTVFRIKEHSLYGCMSLKTLTILDKTDNFYVSYFACQFAPGLETIYYAGTEAQHAEWSIEGTNYAFNAATVVCNYNG